MLATATKARSEKKKSKYPNMVVVVLGAPGAGKGTQSELLAKRLGAEYVAIGNIVRSAAASGTIERDIKEAYRRGELVKDEFVRDKVLKILLTIPKEKPVVFDGFPRAGNQLALFNSILAESGRKVTAVIFLEVTVETAIKRISGRRICSRCGQSAATEESVCSVCGGELVRREDDKPEVVARRTDEYLDTIKEVLDFFLKQRKLIRVDGERKVEEIKREIAKKLGLMK